MLAPTRFLGIDGAIDLDVSGAAARGTLNGRLAIYAGSTNYIASPLVTACTARDHAVILQR